MRTKKHNLGVITLGSSVRISDPCYDMGVWCAKTLDNVLSGEYNAYTRVQDENRYGRVTELTVCHVNYKPKALSKCNAYTCVGVDSGTCGIYDLDYYKKSHFENNIDDDWYSKNVCNGFWDKKSRGSNLDGLGVISTTGYGDGSYYVALEENENGEIYRITIQYLICD